jgi:hypothetical protein
MSKDRKVTALAAAALLLSSLSVDARSEAPAPPKASVYLPVEDLPPPREQPAMTIDERSKLEKELIAARDRHTPDGKAKGGAARRPQPIKP